MPNVSFFVHGKKISNSGTVVLPPGKSELTMNIEDIELKFNFVDSFETDPRVDAKVIDNKSLHFNLVGFTSSLGVAYGMPAVLTLSDKPYGITLIVHAIGETNPARLIAYSIYEE